MAAMHANHSLKLQKCTANSKMYSQQRMAKFNARSSARYSRCRAAASASGSPEAKKVVVVGGGWAGFGAAKHLSEQGYAVTLLDAASNPGGLSAGWRTASGRPVEAGIKGFWYQYHNIFRLLEELGGEWPLTPFTTSGFWNPDGLMAEAPVFSRLQRLPTVLAQFVWTFRLFPGLSLEDRVTMLPFVAVFLDYNSDKETYERYDKMSARELFRLCGVSQRAYERFLKPVMLVGLFAPPEELSAAVMLDTLYFYSLAHQYDFDVCWCNGNVAERIFTPLVKRIEAAGGTILGDRLVTGVNVDSSGAVTSITAKQRMLGLEEVWETDAVVFAVGVTGMQKLVSASPALAAHQQFRAVMNLRSIDCIATRLWLDRKLPTRFPANVLSGFEDSVGATFFNLNDLQDEFKDLPTSVISADFYNASTLLPLSDEEVVAKVMSFIEKCEPGIKGAKVVDSAVLRFPKAVTHFSPGSLAFRPTQKTPIPNLFMAGDWVKDVPHGANGLSQERAYVTGLTAANLVVERLGRGAPAAILPVEPDEPHVSTARTAIRTAKDALRMLGIRSPLL